MTSVKLARQCQGNNFDDIVDEANAAGKVAALRDSSCNTTNLD